MRHPASSAPRWRAASLLLVGGLLAFAASFLPLGQAAYSAAYGDRAMTIVSVPARELLTVIQVNLRAPGESIISGTYFWGFAIWGAPLILAAIGLALFLARRWTPTARTWVPALALILLGAGFTLVSCWFYLYPFFGSQGATRTLAYGPAAALLGFLIALAGTIMTARLRTSSRYGAAG
ncbi:MAG TPA: hypothetical protein VF040_00245 [Ktedonobacterales bacterium]